MNSNKLIIRRLAALTLVGFLVLTSVSSVAVFTPHSDENTGKLAAAEITPVVPVGLDTYRMWDRWAYQRIGVRTYMRCTYDRRGGNESADASHYLYQENEASSGTKLLSYPLDIEGTGVLYCARANHWHGSPWHYELDNTRVVISTSDTARKTASNLNSTYLPKDIYPAPLASTYSQNSGASMMGVPISFAEKFRIGYEYTDYGTGYFIYSLYNRDANLSMPIATFDSATPPDEDVRSLLNKAGQDLIPQTGTYDANQMGIHESSGITTLAANSTETLVTINEAPSTIRAINFSVPVDKISSLINTRVRITWDNRAMPSVDAPVPLFFGVGRLQNSLPSCEYQVKGFPLNIKYDSNRAYLSCYFPMPFFINAKIELVETGGAEINDINWSVRYAPYTDPINHVSYFHATYNNFPDTSIYRNKDLVALDTRGIEGSEEWSGQFVGMSFTFTDMDSPVMGTLEGDPRFFFDDSRSPQVQGTGTEEWAGGGDYFKGGTPTLPFYGQPTRGSAYRYLLSDLMPFGKNAVIRLEHGATNTSVEPYQFVSYWYGTPSATLVQTDLLKVGDLESERSHGYDSPQASEPYSLTSRYEEGPDAGFSAETDIGRYTRGDSKFTLEVEPDNLGVLLRRKLDYKYPNQRAEVYIADGDAQSPKWELAGVWYLAGSNTCIYSDPPGEFDLAMHNVQTSNRQFRDDEFIVPSSLTHGLSKMKVWIRFTPVNRELYPKVEYPEMSAWSEFEYKAYCYRMPEAPVQLPEDTGNPEISEIAVSDILDNEAVVTFNTDEWTSVSIEYGAKVSSLDLTLSGGEGFKTSHLYKLEGLSPNTDYYYRIIAADLAGNETVSQVKSFATGDPAPHSPYILLYEAEDLLYMSPTKDLVSSENDAGCSNGAYRVLNGNAKDDRLQFNVNVPQTGLYEIYVGGRKSSTEGVYQLSINSANQGTPQNQYADSVEISESSLGRKLFSTTGNNTFRFTVTDGVNDGFTCSIDYIKLVKISPATDTRIVYQAENIPAASAQGRAITNENDTRVENATWVQLHATEAGDSIDFTVHVPAAGTYSVSTLYKTLNTRGIIQLYVDGEPVGAPVDMYSEQQLYIPFDWGRVTFTSPGNKIFTFAVTGSNPVSKGFSCSVDYIKLTGVKN